MSDTTKVTVPVSIKKDDGKTVKQNVNAHILKVDKSKLEGVQRALDATSNQQDQDQQYYNEHHIITPPYDPMTLIQYEEESNVLRECFDAMVTNTISFGYHFRPRKVPENEKEQFKEKFNEEEIALNTFFDTICLEDQLLTLNEKLKKDEELTGNSYTEVLRLNGEIVELVYARTQDMRLVKQDDEFTPYNVKRVVWENGDYKIKTILRRKRFRRYVQLDNSFKINAWFKEFGDPRNIDKNTGEVITEKNPPQSKLATEIIHNRIHTPRSPYGIPRWISRIVDILGSRRAAEVNYFTLSNNHVPTLFIMVENGTLSDGSVNRLTELIETQVGDDPNHGKIVIIESEGVENNFGISEASAGKVKIKNVKEAQHGDQLYQDYDKNSRKRTRSAFRLAPLHTGDTDDYSHASVKEARRVTDEQVFAPERNRWAVWLNNILLDQNFIYHTFKFNTPNITDNQILVELLRELNKTGAMSPRRANKFAEDVFEGDLGPMPKGIDPDIPYDIQFAQAQNGQIQADQTEAKEDVSSEESEVQRSIVQDWIEQQLYENH